MKAHEQLSAPNKKDVLRTMSLYRTVSKYPAKPCRVVLCGAVNETEV